MDIPGKLSFIGCDNTWRIFIITMYIVSLLEGERQICR